MSPDEVFPDFGGHAWARVDSPGVGHRRHSKNDVQSQEQDGENGALVGRQPILVVGQRVALQTHVEGHC